MEQTPAILHVHTDASGGRFAIEEIASLARGAGIRVVMTSDKAERSWSYGMAPFRGLSAVTLKEKSVPMSSVGDYISRIEKSRNAAPGMLILPGFEVSPYYRWEGDPRENNLTLLEWDREMLVFGLKKTDDLRGLPFAGNPYAARFTPGSISELILSILLLVISVVLFLRTHKRSFNIGSWRKQKVKYSVHPYRPLALLMFMLSIVIAASGYPFRYFAYSAYDSSPGAAPYAGLINYVDARGGITVWAHPEARESHKYKRDILLPPWLARMPFIPDGLGVSARAGEYCDLVGETQGFNAFSVLYEGCGKMAEPGGVWDRALLNYAAGRRAHPFWAVGELDYYGNEKYKPIDHVQTIFLTEEFSVKGVFDAFRSGRMYVIKKQNGVALNLSDFHIGPVGREEAGKAISGGEICVNTGERVYARIESLPRTGVFVKARLIKNGGVARVYKGEAPLDISYLSPPPPPGRADFYRIDAGSKQSKLFSNPIFVRSDCDNNKSAP
jgi:hypothetical protein